MTQYGRGRFPPGESGKRPGEPRTSALTDALEPALLARLRDLTRSEAATEAQLRTLSEQSEAWARALRGQIDGSEQRLRSLSADPESSLVEIADELRRAETLRAELAELRELLSSLDVRSRELRASWIGRQSAAGRGGGR